MKNTISFNINSHVRVRLTDHGDKIYREFFPGLPSRSLRQRGDDGWTRLGLWELMQIFGQHVSFATGDDDLPFATEILIESNAAQEAADAELQGCQEWISGNIDRWPNLAYWGDRFLAERRPKPPSLKQQALDELEEATQYALNNGADLYTKTIRRALESIPEQGEQR